MQPFAKFDEPLDADEPIGKKYTFRIQVATGDSVTAAAIAVVDSTSSTIVTVNPLLATSQTALGVISPLVYGVTFRAIGSNNGSGRAYVRCRYATFLGNGDDTTYALDVVQR